ncbi:CD209 antigen-like protein A [Paramisgurnus dabryanus]|uniref:CD209 antigen-like protein A n=1 Tax=Paramisgurnus dabryanus TaxID=90735 RepID=UPI0031F3B024
MDAIYGNTDFLDSSINEASYCKGDPTGVHQKRDVTQSKCTKVLLWVLCVSVVLAVGGLCVFGVLYNNQLGDFESLHIQHQRALMTLSAQGINATITERNLKGLTGNLTTVRDQLSFYKAMESELHDLKAKYNRLRASLHDAQFWIYFSTDKRDWSSSRAVCVSMGADLVTITNQKEQDFLLSKIEETHWIGLNDLETEGRWVWVNNKTLEETRVEFWYKRESGKNEPDNWKVKDPSGENCASLGDSNNKVHTMWFDSSCKEPKKFICEKK